MAVKWRGRMMKISITMQPSSRSPTRTDDEEEQGDEEVERNERSRSQWVRRHFARIHVVRALAAMEDGTGDHAERYCSRSSGTRPVCNYFLGFSIIAPSLLLAVGSAIFDFGVVDSNLLLQLRTVLYCFFLAFAAVYV
jgi:hypothetical protein